MPRGNEKLLMNFHTCVYFRSSSLSFSQCGQKNPQPPDLTDSKPLVKQIPSPHFYSAEAASLGTGPRNLHFSKLPTRFRAYGGLRLIARPLEGLGRASQNVGLALWALRAGAGSGPAWGRQTPGQTWPQHLRGTTVVSWGDFQLAEGYPRSGTVPRRGGSALCTPLGERRDQQEGRGSTRQSS